MRWCRSLALAALFPATVHAAGIGRPNVGGARPLGWAGAFTAIADDPSALHHNPAGLAGVPQDAVLVGAELILAPRSYTPLNANGTMGEAQKPSDTPVVLPTLGYVTRLSEDGAPSHLALGIGIWNTFGGQLEYEPAMGRAAIDEVQTAVIEFVPGVAYEVNDFVQLGLALRVGLGLFGIVAQQLPADADVSGTGFGVGFTVGAMIRPRADLSLGLTYRSPLTVPISGDGGVDVAGNNVFRQSNFEHDQEWPAQGSIGVAWKPMPRLTLAAQADWTDWSQLQELTVVFDVPFTQTLETDFHDSYALHAAAQFQASEKFAIRGGYTFDSNAVPDRTIERQYLDANKHGVALGTTVKLSTSWSIDAAFEFVGGPVRHVPDNRDEYFEAGWLDRANVAPGDHEGQVYTFDLAAQLRY